MRILLVTSGYPLPVRKGFQRRALNQIGELTRTHSVSLLSFGPPPDRGDRIHELCEDVVVVPEPGLIRWIHLFRAVFTREPLQSAWYRSQRMRRAVRHAVNSGAFDLIVFQLSRMASYDDEVPPGLPTVVDLVDSMGLNMAQRAASSRFPLSLLWKWEGRKARSYERAVVARHDLALVVSEYDRDEVGSEGVVVNPIGVDPTEFEFATEGRAPARLLFLGRMRYYANADAAVFLAREVFPLVRRRVPAAELVIVGASPPRSVRALRRLPGVEVTGTVPDVRPYLNAATLAVFPMRFGSGMQNKALEAMAVGLPVVTTPMVLRGIRATAGEHVETGATAAELADRVVTLLEDPERRTRLAERARSFVEREYTWERTVGHMAELVDTAAAGKRS